MAFSAAQAARLTGCSRTQVDHWARSGLVDPGEATGEVGCYELRDLVALRVVRSLLDAGLSLGRIRRAVGFLRESRVDVAGLRLVTDGETVWACREDGQILEALGHGRIALFVAVDRFVAEVEAGIAAFDEERRAFVAGLRDESFATGV